MLTRKTVKQTGNETKAPIVEEQPKKSVGKFSVYAKKQQIP